MSAIRAVVAFLALLAAAGCGRDAGQGPASRGAVVYATHCASCHGRDGRGVGRNPPLAGSVTVAGDPQALIAWVMAGRRPATLPPLRGLVVMPQYAWLGDDDLAEVLSHIRSGFGNAQPPVSPAEVAAVRGSLDRP